TYRQSVAERPRIARVGVAPPRRPSPVVMIVRALLGGTEHLEDASKQLLVELDSVDVVVIEGRASTAEHGARHEPLHVPCFDHHETIIKARHAARPHAREDEPRLFTLMAMLEDRQPTRFVRRTSRKPGIGPGLRGGTLLQCALVLFLGLG